LISSENKLFFKKLTYGFQKCSEMQSHSW